MEDEKYRINPIQPAATIDNHLGGQRHQTQSQLDNSTSSLETNSLKIEKFQITFTTYDSELPAAEALRIAESARAAGWQEITVDGNIELRRSLWFAAQKLGLKCTGYQPTLADRRELEMRHKQEQHLRNRPVHIRRLKIDY